MANKIVDLSHHNKVKDWSKLKDAFIIHKCTQGTTYLDPTYKERKDKIQASYHFANGDDPIQEADWYIKNQNEKMLILDWEIEHLDPAWWCEKFIERVKEKTGIDCWLYTNDARALKHTFPSKWKKWIARYKYKGGDLRDTGMPDYAYQPKSDWDIWQFTSNGKVEGIDGRVDLNVSKLPMQTPETPTQGEATTAVFKVLSQKDPKWGEDFIGSSGLKIKNYGCLITCISSLSSWYGKYKDPAWMAKNLSFTPSGLLYWNSITKKELNMRFVYRYYQRNDAKIREILASKDNACILQTEMNGYQHWVALIGYSRILGYKISDPIDGKIRYFNDKYKVIKGYAEVANY